MTRDFISELTVIRDSYTLPDEQSLYDAVDGVINTLSESVGPNILGITFSVKNDYFVAYETLITEVSNWISFYSDDSTIETDVSSINLIFDVDLNAIKSDLTAINNFSSDLNSKITLIENIVSEVSIYFTNLKIFLANTKILDNVYDYVDYTQTGLYQSRSVESQNVIDELKIEKDKSIDDYINIVNTKMEELKITRV